jgi:hypothetical protein
LVLDLFGALGAGTPGHVLSLAQFLFGAFCARRLVGALEASFRVEPSIRVVLLVALTIPQTRWASYALPESMSYSIFLWFVACLVAAVTKGSAGSIAGMGALAALAAQTKPQYMFLYPILALVLLGLLVWRRQRRGIAGAAAAAVVLLVAGHAAQRVYNYVLHDSFTGVSNTGIQLLAVQVYIMDPGEVQALPEPEDRELLGRVFEVLERRGLVPWMTCAGGDVLACVYNTICWEAIVPAYSERAKTDVKRSTTEWLEMDRDTTRLAVSIIRTHPLRHLRHVVATIYRSERFMIVLVVLLVGTAGGLAWRTGHPFWVIAGLTGLMALSNLTLVATVEPLLLRYTYPTDIIILVPLMVLWRGQPVDVVD